MPPNAKMHLQPSLPVPGNSEFWLQVHLFFTIGLTAGKSPPFWRTAPDGYRQPLLQSWLTFSTAAVTSWPMGWSGTPTTMLSQ